MAQLYFKFGAMGSSKTANALMARFNYEERGQETLLVKPRLDTRDGDHMVYSRIGLKHPCIYFDEMREMSETELQTYACIIIDEAQFLTKDEVYYLVHLVDDCSIPVICYGLRAHSTGALYPRPSLPPLPQGTGGHPPGRDPRAGYRAQGADGGGSPRPA